MSINIHILMQLKKCVSVDAFATHKCGDTIDIEGVCSLLSDYVSSLLVARSAMLKERRQAKGERYFGPDGMSRRSRNRDRNKNADRKDQGEDRGDEG